MSPVLEPSELLAQEEIIFDPAEVAEDRTELNANAAGLRIKWEGIDWGEAAISAYMADQERGSIPVDFRVPNRTVTIPMIALEEEADSYVAARTSLQKKIALFQREGGWLKREMEDGSVLYLDIVNATLKMGGSTLSAIRQLDVDIEVTLECIPDFYGDEVALDLITETTAAEVARVLQFSAVNAVIKGDYPGRCRIVVTDTQAANQLGLFWGFRSRHYSSAFTAALAYEAEALTNLDTAADAALSGASGGTVVQHTSLLTSWTPVLSTGWLTHTGTYRARARVRSPSGSDVSIRLGYDVGDFVNPTINSTWTFPAADNFYVADLGEIRLDQVPAGTHRWQGHIDAKGAVGGEDVQIDRLWFQPVDEFAGSLRAVQATTFDTISARDNFNNGVDGTLLNTRTADSGGTWATSGGDAVDFRIETSGVHGSAAEGGGGGIVLTRTEVSDADTSSGRWAVLGAANFTNMVVQADFARSSVNPTSWTTQELRRGVLARYVDNSNWVGAFLRVGGASALGIQDSSAAEVLSVVIRVAGTTTVLDTVAFDEAAGSFHTVALRVDATGAYHAYAVRQGNDLGSPLISGYHSALASGGALVNGKPGLYDAYTHSTANTREVDNVVVFVASPEAVIFASQSVEIQTEGAIREDTTGTAYGPVSYVLGDLPRLPPSGLEDRPVEVFVKSSRGDLDQLPDSAIDDLTLQVYGRPSWLFVPEA